MYVCNAKHNHVRVHIFDHIIDGSLTCTLYIKYVHSHILSLLSTYVTNCSNKLCKLNFNLSVLMVTHLGIQHFKSTILISLHWYVVLII